VVSSEFMKGKYYFLLASFLAVIEQIYLMIAVYLKIGNEKLSIHLVKLIVLLLLISIIYFKGSKLALWMLSAWYIFGGIFAFGEINGNYFSIYAAMAIFYLGFIFFINLFPPISKFIESQKLKA